VHLLGMNPATQPFGQLPLLKSHWSLLAHKPHFFSHFSPYVPLGHPGIWINKSQDQSLRV